jgi:hypothetical protein
MPKYTDSLKKIAKMANDVMVEHHTEFEKN